MHSYEINKHGKIVFPSNCFPDLDFSTFESLEQLDAVVRRDFDAKAPTGTYILERIKTGAYTSKFELMRDMALNLFWANRFKITMYEVQPTRWADVPRSRDDVFVPILTPWEDRETKVTAVMSAYPGLPAQWDDEVEDGIFEILFDVFGHRRNHATKLSAVVPTVADLLSDPRNQTLRLSNTTPTSAGTATPRSSTAMRTWPSWRRYTAGRWSCTTSTHGLATRPPWSPSKSCATTTTWWCFVRVTARSTVSCPASRRRTSRRRPTRRPQRFASRFARTPRSTCATTWRYNLASMAIGAAHGDLVCTNEDLIRNSAYNWSPMSAADIVAKTGIEQRRYTSESLEDLSLRAARSALAHAAVGPDEIGAVIVCTCTSSRLLPSVATWLSGALGIQQTHCSFDLVAACAGLSYGLAEALRVLQLVQRPVLVVCAEKFSDKIGNVRPSRMIFGDGASAIILGVAPEGAPPDIEYMQTYASGPVSQVNSILWPNPAFANNVTVFGPEVKALAGRYLRQMLDDIRALPDPDGVAESLLASIDLIVPHQANKTMVIELATAAGLSPDQLYFNIERVGNASSASIPLAIDDAVRDGVITKPTRVFAPGFGAGAVAGYAILRIDPAVVAPADQSEPTRESAAEAESLPMTTGSDAALAFG